MNITRNMITTVLVIATVFLGSIAQAPAVVAESRTGYLVVEGGACASRYGLDTCKNAKKAADWAQKMTINKVNQGVFKNGDDGTMANAFQHCTWMGALSVWYGYDTAVGIGSIHETVNQNPYPLTTMDYFNNSTGASIGVEAVNLGVSDGWGYVMNKCESLAKSGSLFGPCAIQGNYIGDAKVPYAPAEQQTCSPN